MPTSKDVAGRHQHFLEQYINGQVKEFLPFLRRVVADLKKELLKTTTVTSKARIEAKLKIVESIITDNMNSYTAIFNEQARAFAVSEAAFAQSTLVQSIGLNTVLPSEAQLWAAVNARPFDNKLLKEALNDFTRKQSRLIKNAISTGFYEGKTTPDIIREVVGTRKLKYKDGILNITRNEAERTVRTALNHTASVARAKTFEDNSDLIPYYEWVSTLDGRTSNVCKSLDGTVYKVGKGKLPPAHQNCRSSTAPLLRDEVNAKSMKKLAIGGKRASMNGQVSADLNYGDWLKRQSKDFQDKALGKTRAELFRKGGLSLDKFVNDADQTLTLEQLKTTYPTAWGKAKLNPVD
jgi:SPP1 gp7 family putative phage head morphogenesis protein